MRFYIHTIDGRPGYFDGEQIVFAENYDHWQDDYPLCVARSNEGQIRDDQRRSRAFRLNNKFDVPRYDFIIVSTRRGVIARRNER